MNSFETSDQMDFNNLSGTITTSASKVQSSVDRSTESLNEINSEFKTQRTLLNRIHDGIAKVGSGIAGIGRAVNDVVVANTDDFGVHKKDATLRGAAMATGPIGVAVTRMLQNSNINIGEGIKNSISSGFEKVKGLVSRKDRVDDSGFQDATGLNNGPRLPEQQKQIELQQQEIQAESNNTNRLIEEERINTTNIINTVKQAALDPKTLEKQSQENSRVLVNSITDMKDELAGVQNARTGKKPESVRTVAAKVPVVSSVASSIPIPTRRSPSKANSAGSGAGDAKFNVEVVSLLQSIAQTQSELKSSFQDDAAPKGGLLKSLARMTWEMSAYHFFFKGRYAGDIERSANPIQTIINVLMKIYEWERLFGDLSRRQLNELIRLGGGKPQKIVGQESLFATYAKRKAAEWKKKIDDHFGEDSWLGKTLKGGLSAASFLASFSHEQMMDKAWASASGMAENDTPTDNGKMQAVLASREGVQDYIDALGAAREEDRKTLIESVEDFYVTKGLSDLESIVFTDANLTAIVQKVNELRDKATKDEFESELRTLMGEFDVRFRKLSDLHDLDFAKSASSDVADVLTNDKSASKATDELIEVANKVLSGNIQIQDLISTQIEGAKDLIGTKEDVRIIGKIDKIKDFLRIRDLPSSYGGMPINKPEKFKESGDGAPGGASIAGESKGFLGGLIESIGNLFKSKEEEKKEEPVTSKAENVAKEKETSSDADVKKKGVLATIISSAEELFKSKEEKEKDKLFKMAMEDVEKDHGKKKVESVAETAGELKDKKEIAEASKGTVDSVTKKSMDTTDKSPLEEQAETQKNILETVNDIKDRQKKDSDEAKAEKEAEKKKSLWDRIKTNVKQNKFLSGVWSFLKWFLSSPTAMAMATVLGILIKFPKVFEWWTDSFTNFFQGFVMFRNLRRVFMHPIQSLTYVAKGLGNAFKFLGSPLRSLSLILKNLGKFTGKFKGLDKLLGHFVRFLGDASKFLGAPLKTTAGFLHKMANFIGKFKGFGKLSSITKSIQQFSAFLHTMGKTVSGWSKMFSGFAKAKNFMKPIVSMGNFFNKIGKSMGKIGTMSKALSKLSGLIAKFSKFISSLQKGGSFIGKVIGVISRIGKMLGGVGKIFGKGGGMIAKLGTKFGLKALGKIPGLNFIGSIITFFNSIGRFRKGQWGRGALEMGSAIANLFPGPGSLISLALDGLVMMIDIFEKNNKKAAKEKGPVKVGGGKLFLRLLPGIGSIVAVMDGINNWKKGHKARAFVDFAAAVPGVGMVVSALQYLWDKTEPVKGEEEKKKPVTIVGGVLRAIPGIGTLIYAMEGIKHWRKGEKGKALLSFGKSVGTTVGFGPVIAGLEYLFTNFGTVKPEKDKPRSFAGAVLRGIPVVGTLLRIGDAIGHWKQGRIGRAMVDAGMAIGVSAGLGPVIAALEYLFTNFNSEEEKMDKPRTFGGALLRSIPFVGPIIRYMDAWSYFKQGSLLKAIKEFALGTVSLVPGAGLVVSGIEYLISKLMGGIETSNEQAGERGFTGAALRAIPVIGPLIRVIDGVKNMFKGNFWAGMGDLTKGAISLVPGAGLLVSGIEYLLGLFGNKAKDMGKVKDPGGKSSINALSDEQLFQKVQEAKKDKNWYGWKRKLMVKGIEWMPGLPNRLKNIMIYGMYAKWKQENGQKESSGDMKSSNALKGAAEGATKKKASASELTDLLNKAKACARDTQFKKEKAGSILQLKNEIKDPVEFARAYIDLYEKWKAKNGGSKVSNIAKDAAGGKGAGVKAVKKLKPISQWQKIKLALRHPGVALEKVKPYVEKGMDIESAWAQAWKDYNPDKDDAQKQQAGKQSSPAKAASDVKDKNKKDAEKGGKKGDVVQAAKSAAPDGANAGEMKSYTIKGVLNGKGTPFEKTVAFSTKGKFYDPVVSEQYINVHGTEILVRKHKSGKVSRRNSDIRIEGDDPDLWTPDPNAGASSKDKSIQEVAKEAQAKSKGAEKDSKKPKSLWSRIKEKGSELWNKAKDVFAKEKELAKKGFGKAKDILAKEKELAKSGLNIGDKINQKILGGAKVVSSAVSNNWKNIISKGKNYAKNLRNDANSFVDELFKQNPSITKREFSDALKAKTKGWRNIFKAAQFEAAAFSRYGKKSEAKETTPESPEGDLASKKARNLDNVKSGQKNETDSQETSTIAAQNKSKENTKAIVSSVNSSVSKINNNSVNVGARTTSTTVNNFDSDMIYNRIVGSGKNESLV